MEFKDGLYIIYGRDYDDKPLKIGSFIIVNNVLKYNNEWDKNSWRSKFPTGFINTRTAAEIKHLIDDQHGHSHIEYQGPISK